MAQAETTGPIHFVFSYDDGGMAVEELGYFTTEDAAETALTGYVDARIEEFRAADRASYGGRAAQHGRDRDFHQENADRGLLVGPFLTPAPEDPEGPAYLARQDQMRRMMRSSYAVVSLKPGTTAHQSSLR